MISLPLNKYVVEMVKPKTCIRGFGDSIYRKDMPYEYCKSCVFRKREACVYEEYTVEAAEGSIEKKGERDEHYIQFCCANCGEIVQLVSYLSYLYHNLSHNEHVCKKCKTLHIYLDRGNSGDHIYKFAVPVGKIGGKK